MPCNCDHMEPSQHEAESKRVAKHLVYVLTALKKPVPTLIKQTADSYYGDSSQVHKLTANLCKVIDETLVIAMDEIMYDGRVKEARALAAWWQAHKAADVIKAEKQARINKKAKLVEGIKGKLSAEEWEAINK